MPRKPAISILVWPFALTILALTTSLALAATQTREPGWHLIPSPNRYPTGSNVLLGTDAISANDVWAVGWATSPGNAPALIEHWDGSAWNIVPSPDPITGSYSLQDVSALSTTDAWAVGFQRHSADDGLWTGTSTL